MPLQISRVAVVIRSSSGMMRHRGRGAEAGPVPPHPAAEALGGKHHLSEAAELRAGDPGNPLPPQHADDLQRHRLPPGLRRAQLLPPGLHRLDWQERQRVPERRLTNHYKQKQAELQRPAGVREKRVPRRLCVRGSSSPLGAVSGGLNGGFPGATNRIS